MRLSEAIRLGAMLNPQGWRRLKDFDGSTCAIGAALEAVGHKIIGGEADYRAARQAFPILCWFAPRGMFGPTVFETVWHLNDASGKTREQIADWVETLEPQEVEAPEPAPVCAAGGRER